MARDVFTGYLTGAISAESLLTYLDCYATLMRLRSDPPDVRACNIFATCYDTATKRGIPIENNEYKKLRVMAELELYQ